jgi:hypothetical protein
MTIWFAMLIPVLVIATLIIKGNGCLAWWEGLLMFFAPLLLIAVFKYTTESFQVSDTEWWGNYAVTAAHYDRWNEYIHKTCSEKICSGSGKSRSCHTRTYDCSYVENHPEYWEMVPNQGAAVGISSNFYRELVARWGNEKFVEMNRHYHTIDGDAHKTDFDGIWEHTEPIITEHSYENRVAASDSILNFPDMEEGEVKKLQLFEYPKMNGWRHPVILGWNDPAADWALQIMNGRLGASKQVKVLVLVWKGRDKTVVEKQEQYWKGGNKNEFVVNVGVDEAGVIKWGEAFCWTSADNPSTELLRIETRNHINELRDQPLNLVELANWLRPELEAKWKRQSFKKFSYITVDPPTWAVVLTFIFTGLLCGGLGWWCATNEFTHQSCSTDNPFGQGRKFGRGFRRF